MRVVLVTTWFPTRTQPGRGVFVARHAAAMQAAGHEVRVVHLVPGGDDDGVRHTRYGTVPVLRVPMTPSRPDQVLAARRRLGAATRGADLVHTHAVSALLPYIPARPRLPWLHTEHWSGIAGGRAELSGLARYGAQAVLAAERLPDVVTVVSQALATDLAPYRAGRPVLVVPNEVAAPHRLRERRTVSLGSEALRLIGVGGLIERKNPLLAIRVVAELGRLGVPARLSWAGSGPLEDDCVGLARELGVDLELLGQVEASQVPELLGDHDLFLVPTRAETFFLGAAEAIAAGRPVVTGDRGGHTDFLDPRVCALVAGEDPAVWARELLSLLSRCQELSAVDIRSTLPEAFRPERVAEAYSRAYEAAVKAYHHSA